MMVYVHIYTNIPQQAIDAPEVAKGREKELLKPSYGQMEKVYL